MYLNSSPTYSQLKFLELDQFKYSNKKVNDKYFDSLGHSMWTYGLSTCYFDTVSLYHLDYWYWLIIKLLIEDIEIFWNFQM